MQQLRTSLALADLQVWCDYYIEFEAAPSAADLSSVAGFLSGGVAEVRVVVDEPLDTGCMVQVSHRRGVVDNESATIVAMCGLVGLPARAARVALSYQSRSPRLVDTIRASRFNRGTEELHLAEPVYQTLVPLGCYEPAQRFDLRGLSDAELAGLGVGNGRNLDLDQMRQIQEIQQTTGVDHVTDVLLEALDARWSDHCSHTTWRSLGGLLDRLAAAARDTGNPNILSMFHDNAGVWDFYAGYAVALKAETHNGPSAVSAYFGQLTKLGGVLRDILGTGLGADPIGCFEHTATGIPGAAAPIAGRPGAREIAVDTIRAIKEYGNTFGVAMMCSRMAFHPKYRAKPFALGGAIGLLPVAAAQRGEPRPGDLVVLIGGLTGNEGIHGASASSAGATMDEAAVQIGAPLEQVKFRAAIVDLRDGGCLRALTDVGGAGLNSAVGEIGEPGGVFINTALVPLKTRALAMWRILLSESQERMVLAVPPERLAQARLVTARQGVRATVIGRFTGTGRYMVCHNPALGEAGVIGLGVGQLPADVGEVGFDVPYRLLEHVPAQRPVPAPPAPGSMHTAWPDLRPPELAKLLTVVAGDTEVASQHYAQSQYDSTVGGNTWYGPRYGTREHRVATSYWAATPVDGHPGAVVFATAFNPWLYDIHPVRALRQMFCALLGRQVLAGVALRDVCLCDNFYTPHRSEHADGWLVAMVDELAALVRHFGTPVISGKDSSAGSTDTDEGPVHVPPAVFLSALGKVPDKKLLLPEAWQRPDSILVRVGPPTPSPAGTAAARALTISSNQVDDVDPIAYLRYLHALTGAWHVLRSATPIGPGGLAARLLTGALATGIGVVLNPGQHNAEALFAEHRCGALVEIDPQHLADLPAALTPVPVGRLDPTPGLRLAGEDLLTADATDRWTGSFTARIM
jgi:phosphoribosylformylglycinamidine synthase